MELNEKVIFLTGGSDGIGRACAIAYAKEGASVVLCARNEAKAKQVAESLQGDHFGIRCDVSVGSEVKAAIEFVIEAFGRIDAIHNNAGNGSLVKPIDQTTEAEWDHVFNTNLKSVYWTTRFGIDALRRSQGCILNTSSMVGVMGQLDHAAYTATKGAMNTLTKSMALDYAADGIRVNAVCPAGTWTPMLRDWVSQQPDPAVMENYLNDIHALGYCPEGDVIADASVFLISQRARFVTGHILHVSGGAELGYRKTN
ncbi:SDR family NAD(P)-dependent oxidoreductase [Novipirellula artificiosorum]|uniref:4-formylbenzenesulfonate dehydrogenase TsaC1/TsaC2 n=1 Tax=Novipirellula artificiosorum TaxID=2528016 RepID=A0A5C6DMI6_9BACT|nr:SDR family oxidoreductase [Novipirellula artificiosorum]TWU37375.1 4-formylbenzenesulfonate dehydrogenase TsaC1/TsaC2 [Novipirellula artificiosorum]